MKNSFQALGATFSVALVGLFLTVLPAAAQNAVVNFKTSNTSPGSKPVTDTLGLPVNCISGCSGGGGAGAVFGPTAAGSAAANPPVLLGGTVDGTATGAVDNLKVSGGLAFINCANCSGSGASASDEAAFVAGTSVLAPGGGFYQTTATSNPLTTGQTGMWQLTANRAGFVNVRNASGAELGLTAAPFITAGAGVAGTPAGGVVSIQGVVSGTAVPVSGAFFQSTQPISIASAQVASGAFASGAIGSGAMVDLGAIADAAATAGSTGTLSAKLRLMTTQLGTINTTLGSPFQAGGSIGNTTFAATQGTAANLNATVVGTGTFPVQLTGATNNINNIAGTITLPTGAATSANQTNASQKTQIVDGSGNVIASTSNNLNVQCANCSGSGVSAADAASFTAGTSLFAPVGGQFTSGGATACVTGHECTAGMTADRAIFANLADIAGTATSTGNGTSGAGVQRVAIASDNTAFSVNATLQAGATTAIGKVDPNTLASWGLIAVGGAAAPTNALVGGTIYNSSPITITATQAAALQSDVNGYLKVNVQSAVGLAQGSTTSGQTGSLVMGAVTTSAPTYTTAQTSPLSIDTAGNLRVNVVTGGSGGGAVFGPTAVGSAAANPPVLMAGTANAGATGNVQVAKVTSGGVLSTDLSTVNAVTTLTGTGAVGTGAQRIAVGTDTATIAGSAPGTAGAASANVVTVQGVASMTKLLVTPDSVALPANQSVNVAQFGGVSTSTGQVAVSTAPVTATNTALVVDLRPDSPGIIALGPAAVSGSVPFTYSSQYPTNATTTTPTAVTASATGTTAATAATLGATASVTNYVCGFDITADATALATGTAVLSGTISGSLSYLYTITAVTNGTATLSRTFNPCIPASAANTAITMTSAAAGTGGNTIVNIFGYRL